MLNGTTELKSDKKCFKPIRRLDAVTPTIGKVALTYLRQKQIRILVLTWATGLWALRPCEGQIRVDAYISNRDSNTVSIIDTLTNTVTATLPTGNLPIGVSVTPDGRFVYVVNNGSNTVSVIDAATNTMLPTTIPVGSQPFGVAVAPDAKQAFVTNTGILGTAPGNTVSVINTTSNTADPATVTVGSSPLGVAITPDGQSAFVANNTPDNNVSIFGTAPPHTSGGPPIPVQPGPEGIAITPNGKLAYVSNTGLFGAGGTTVSKIDITTHTSSLITVGDLPVGVAITPNGNFVYVANEQDNSVSVISTSDDTIVATITVGVRPFGVAITPNGQFVYVTNSGNFLGSDTVSVIATATNTLVATITVGNEPFTFGSFIGPNIIVSAGGPLKATSDADLTALGFGNPSLGFQTFVDFNGGSLQTTGDLVTSRTISLLTL
jgi:YVTN family beta-propeller protein